MQQCRYWSSKLADEDLFLLVPLDLQVDMRIVIYLAAPCPNLRCGLAEAQLTWEQETAAVAPWECDSLAWSMANLFPFSS